MNVIVSYQSFTPAYTIVGHSLLTKAVAFVRNELAVHAAVRELEQMDARALADIGICRADIHAAVGGRLKTK